MTGYVVTPLLFQVLDDRQLAGMIAGHLFTANSYIGLVCGVLLLLGVLVKCVGSRLKDSRVWMLVLMITVIIAGQFVIQPILAELKAGGLPAGSKEAIEFGRLHGIASILFLINSVLGLVLVGRGKFWSS